MAPRRHAAAAAAAAVDCTERLSIRLVSSSIILRTKCSVCLCSLPAYLDICALCGQRVLSIVLRVFIIPIDIQHSVLILRPTTVERCQLCGHKLQDRDNTLATTYTTE